MRSFYEQAEKDWANSKREKIESYFIGYEEGIDFILEDIIEALKIAKNHPHDEHPTDYLQIAKWIERRYELNK